MATRLAPHFIELVYDALLKSFWRKKALRNFLRRSHVSENFLGQLSDDESKRDWLDRLFRRLEESERGQAAIQQMAKALIDDPEANMVKMLEIFITADRIGARLGGRSKETPYKNDPNAKPKTFDTELGDGSTGLGIYKLEGDTPTICYCNANKKERPKDFECKERAKEILMVLKRVKK